MKNFFKALITSIIAFVVMITSSITAFAAGTETWYDQLGPWEFIRVTDSNLTPVKTIGRDGGRLRISATVTAVQKAVNIIMIMSLYIIRQLL